MTPFSSDQWVMLLLVFVLGLVIGMRMLAGGKWKKRYRDEQTQREALETENQRLRKEAAEMDTLRHAAARNPGRRDATPGPL